MQKGLYFFSCNPFIQVLGKISESFIEGGQSCNPFYSGAENNKDIGFISLFGCVVSLYSVLFGKILLFFQWGKQNVNPFLRPIGNEWRVDLEALYPLARKNPFPGRFVTQIFIQVLQWECIASQLYPFRFLFGKTVDVFSVKWAECIPLFRSSGN